MALDFNDTIDNDGTFKSQHMVFRDGVKVKFPDKNADIFFGILPAIADKDDKTSYLPYRDKETGKFTRWATPAYYYPFVNKERSILSPATLDPNAFDPIAELIKVAKSHPEYNIIAGYGPDGRKLADAFKNPEVKIPSRTLIFIVNGIILYDREISEEEVYAVQIPSTAFKGQAGGTDKKSTWGLVSALNMRNRGSLDTEEDLDTKYFWGDITDPRKLVPVKLSQEKSPTGGNIKIYNLVPQDEETVKTSKSVLEKRYDLDNIFYDIDEKEIVDYLVHAFSNVPQLLKSAFASRIPGFDKMLKAATAKYSFAPEDEEDDFLTVTRPKKKIEEEASEDDFAPTVKASKRSEETEEDVTPVRNFAPKIDNEEDDDLNKEPVARTVPKRKVSAEAKTSLRNLIEDED